MATLQKRLDRLEATHSRNAVERPSVIFLCEAGGEAMVALRIAGGFLARETGESAEAFAARAEALNG